MDDERLEARTSDLGAQALDAATAEVLRLLLSLSPETASRLRDAAPRRRPRRSQHGPGLDLGSTGDPPG